MRKTVCNGLALGVLGATMFALGPTAQAQTADAATAPAIPAWLSKVTLGGDIRLRYNNVDQTTGSPASNGHNEALFLRARLGVVGKVNDNLTANFRLSTAGVENGNWYTTSNQQLGDEGGKKLFFLDIASFDYKPVDYLVVTGGRAVNPFFSAGKNEMIWSADLAHEGVNMKYAREVGMWKPFLTVGYNQWTDRGAGSADTTMIGGQLGTGMKTDALNATVAVSHYSHNNIKGQNAASGGGGGVGFGNGAVGNTTTAVGGVDVFTNDYKLNNVELELGTEALGLPLAVYGGWVQNSEADSEKDGFIGGVRAGRLKDPGSWVLDVWYRELKRDAVVGTFNDAIAFGGGTNNKGMRATAQYQLDVGNIVSVSGIWGQNNVQAGELPYRRVLVEYLTSF